jgi:prepilin-type N-terminal cleavage/methylation domain-containing protein
MTRITQEQRCSDEFEASSQQQGFSLVELMVAAVVFLVGIVAVMQLVPAAMQSNIQNRVDTASVVVAQRELDQMTAQPLSNSTFTDADGNLCDLGNNASNNVVVGSPLVQVGDFVKIDFSAATVNGYNLLTTAPANAPEGSYDVRWAVIATLNATGAVASKRFIVGARRVTGTGGLLPVSLDSWQQMVQ